jgi:hypothetical protein
MPAYDDLTEELLQHGTSILGESSRLPCALDYVIRPVWPGAQVQRPPYSSARVFARAQCAQ